ncbi:hypothetical protein [Paenibacillus illinoisensis]|uniref:hypothetical protein n=1 Tax=Paenibacillus illinoisensis TaxID=59845 RepID=UPI00203B7887|nr:hypothetical protein [Paenibacillus illinoisensis]MCM3208528.1 hypothetical protein [Paenibacillus illinoisensis]
MQMQVRIKASDKFEDRFALSLAGGEYAERPYPVFIFENQAQRNNYDRIRRQLREETQNGTTQQGNPNARTASRKYRRSREFRI